MSSNKTFYFYFSYSPYLLDVAGNRFASNFRTFVTGDQLDGDAPTLVAQNILSGAEDIPVNAPMILQFDEAISPLCLANVSIRSGLDTIETDNSRSSDGKTITIKPTQDLSINAIHSAVAFGLCDYAGNSYSGTVSTFTTAASALRDTTGPAITNIVPASNSTGIAIDSNVVITFDEKISGSSKIILYKGSTAIDGTVSIAGNTLTFTPSIDLENNIQYRIEIRGTVPDFVNNARYLGDYYFTTTE